MTILARACVLSALSAMTLAICNTGLAQQVSLKSNACSGDNAGLKLSPGFCATIFADDIGHARHMAVTKAGVLYVNTWSGRYYGNDKPHDGGFLVALQDKSGKGKADVIERFGETVQTGGAGGTGIALYGGYLYAEVNDRIVRYKLDAGGITPKSQAEVVLSGLPLTGDHPMHPFAIDADGKLYVDLGSITNSCQEKNRALKSPGLKPCIELETRGGIWRYDAKKLDQKFSPAERYATGIRNAVGIALDVTGRGLYATQHGRDQLSENWPDLYKPVQGPTLPAEELLHVKEGGDYGWPTCYYDAQQKKLVLAPEFGGDGGKAVGDCASKLGPAAAFPAHWAPNDLKFYAGKQFPARYRNGVFIAFHGSWNRAPYPQEGFNVVFQPLTGGMASGECEIFADGFAGEQKERGKAAQRPSGLAVAPDGALFIADDMHGRIYRVTYRGGEAASAKPTLCPRPDASPGELIAARPAAATTASASSTPGPTREMLETGNQLYHASMCVGCHGADATGNQLGPNLADEKWLWSDGSLAGIAKTITDGVSQPKEFRAAMPPLGGAQWNAEQVNAVAAYLWSLSHRTATAATVPVQPAPYPPAAITLSIPGEKVFPESLTETRDGALIIGSVGTRTIWRAKPGSMLAEQWIAAPPDNTGGVFGVYADEKSNTLWACFAAPPAAAGSPAGQASLRAFDLKSGKPKGQYVLPTAGAFCNDIVVAADGAVYVTDSRNNEVVSLKKHAKQLEVWASADNFGPKGGIVDGLAILGNRLFVNALVTGKLYSVTIERDGKAGASGEMKLERALARPDGMRSLNGDLYIVESGGGGSLTRAAVKGDAAQLTTIKEGFPGEPVAVAFRGKVAYVLEGQAAARSNPNIQPQPFRAVGVELPSR